MNRKIILVLALVLASLFAVDFVFAAKVTCLRTIDDYWCTEVNNISFCDPEYGTVKNNFQCEKVCCVNVEGQCNSFLTNAECKVFGGDAAGPGACYRNNVAVYPECNVGSCNLVGDLRITTKNECNVLAANLGLSSQEYKFEVGSQSSSDIRSNSLSAITGASIQSTMNSLPSSSGCCVLDGECSIRGSGNCFLAEGEFHQGTICGNVNECGSSCEGTNVECSFDGSSIITKNGCGEIINVNPCGGGTPFCDDTEGKPQCISNDCVIGGKTVFSAVEVGGKLIPSKESIPTTYELLGKKQKRQNGESWCMIFGQIGGDDEETRTTVYFREKSDALLTYGDEVWKQSAGLTSYRFTCNSGRVTQSQCGGEFRDKICVSSVETDLITTRSEYSERDLYCDGKIDEFHRKVVYLKDGDVFEEARCVPNLEDQIKDCKALFPKGSLFYQPTSSSPHSSSVIQVSQCNQCGKGFWNVCGQDECRRLDDCTAVGPSFKGVAGQCAKYAFIFETTWLTLGSGLPKAFPKVNPGWKLITQHLPGKTLSILIPSFIGGTAVKLVYDDIKSASEAQEQRQPEYIGDGRIQ